MPMEKGYEGNRMVASGLMLSRLRSSVGNCTTDYMQARLLPTVVGIWLTLPAVAALAQEIRTGIWWKDCEQDVRYNHAYDNDHSYGHISGLGGWIPSEVKNLAGT